MWGIHRGWWLSRLNWRFIPTRVGNTWHAGLGYVWHEVHPHACGEYHISPMLKKCGGGSSPRVWGILQWSAGQVAEFRFIPTRVGNTSSNWISQSVVSVHPHACGEYTFSKHSIARLLGSSPRVWGIRDRQNRKFSPGRFIPTRVGNTG